ncbi:MAG TPA: dipeptidase [Candidatus Lumbricidophila sp.]|nr:dipeptidase [Candidatus Lumbricidophila sp.]
MPDTHGAAAGSPNLALTQVVTAGFPALVADLAKLVRIPSVSWPAFDPAHVSRSAHAVAALLTDTGLFDEVEVRQEPEVGGTSLGHPAVLARRAAKPGFPTVLLYAHHDVQPPGDDAPWATPPFEPTVRGDRMFGRGAADDKAGVIAHVGALRALADLTGELGLGISVFIEGEEEWGSASFGTFLAEHRETLRADAIIVADSDNFDVQTPSLTVALRGAVAFNVTVATLAHASHSGMFGGAVPDAMLATVQLLNTLWNPDGSVAVHGLTSAAMDVPAYDDAQLRAEAGLLDGVSPIGSGPILARLWAQPSITVTGIDAPSIANASNTLVPAVRVRVSARIAPGQDAAEAERLLRDHLIARAPFGARLSFDQPNVGDAFLVDTSGWAVDEMLSAMHDAWGKPPVQVGVGGSIPFIAELVGVFPEAQVLVTGVEDPHTMAHSPNESVHLGVLKRAILTEALFLSRLNARGQGAAVS